jgi:hypothetical protein
MDGASSKRDREVLLESPDVDRQVDRQRRLADATLVARHGDLKRAHGAARPVRRSGYV